MKKLTRAGFEVFVESGAGLAANYNDAEYEAAGASIVPRETALACENLVCIRFPGTDGIAAGTNLACVSILSDIPSTSRPAWMPTSRSSPWT